MAKHVPLTFTDEDLEVLSKDRYDLATLRTHNFQTFEKVSYLAA